MFVYEESEITLHDSLFLKDQTLIIKRHSLNDAVAELRLNLTATAASKQGEIINLNWLDIDKNVATIRETKNGISRQIPLSKIAIKSIENLPKHISKNQIF